jgi:vitamin B12 transporter
MGNPNLRPETSKGYDFGFEQPLFNDRFRLGLTRYGNKIENLIASDRTFTTLVNVDESDIRGYEAFAALVVNSQLSFRTDYTYTRIEATSDLAIVRRPPHKYSVTALWSPIMPLQLSATVVTTSGWRDLDRVTFATIDQPGYATVNLAANYQVNDNVKAFGRIDNLFNRHYESPNGFLRPGFGAYAGISVANR